MIVGSKSTSAQSLKMALARARALKMCSGGVMTDPLGCSSSYSPLATRGQQTLPQGNECLLLQPNSLLPRKELAIAKREGQKWAFLRPSIREVAPTIAPYLATSSSNVSSQVLTVLFGLRSPAGASSTSRHPWEMISTCSRKDGMM